MPLNNSFVDCSQGKSFLLVIFFRTCSKNIHMVRMVCMVYHCACVKQIYDVLIMSFRFLFKSVLVVYASLDLELLHDAKSSYLRHVCKLHLAIRAMNNNIIIKVNETHAT